MTALTIIGATLLFWTAFAAFVCFILGRICEPRPIEREWGNTDPEYVANEAALAEIAELDALWRNR